MGQLLPLYFLHCLCPWSHLSSVCSLAPVCSSLFYPIGPYPEDQVVGATIMTCPLPPVLSLKAVVLCFLFFSLHLFLCRPSSSASSHCPVQDCLSNKDNLGQDSETRPKRRLSACQLATIRSHDCTGQRVSRRLSECLPMAIVIFSQTALIVVCALK